jgi:hypothetical protein
MESFSVLRTGLSLLFMSKDERADFSETAVMYTSDYFTRRRFVTLDFRARC